MRYWLPKEKGYDGKKNPNYREQLSSAVRMLVDNGVSARNPMSIEWKVNHYYLQGVRNFHIDSYKTGTISATWESNEGQLKFKLEDVLGHYQTELGVFLDLDPRPLVKPRKKSELDGIRKAAAAQVWLDHVLGSKDLTKIQLEQVECLLKYGTVGTGVFNDNRTSLEEGCYIATIPPWEFVPVPSKPTRSAEAVGLIRHRWVPYVELKEVLGVGLEYPKMDNPEKGLDERLDIRWVPLGDKKPERDGDPDGYGTGPISYDPRSGLGGNTSEDVDSQPYVELVECWIYDYNMKVDRRIVLLGRWLAQDVDFSQEKPENKPYAPIAIARAMHAGGFWGRPWLSDLVSLNNEGERNWANLFKNVQDYDQFGTTLYPLNMGLQQHHFESKNRTKAAGYEPDYMGNNFTIQRITPTNSGTLPMDIANSVAGMMDRRAAIGELLRGDVPGRLESAAALGVVHETSMVSRRAIIASLNNSWGHNFKCLLQKGRGSGVTRIKLQTVDHRLAGIAVNSNGELNLDTNLLPSPDEVYIMMRGGKPQLHSQKQQEVLANFDRGLIPPKKLAWINHEEDLGLSLGMEGVVREIEQCMLHNLILYGDGETPGTVSDPEHADHMLWADTILEFMRGDAYRLAADPVKAAFVDRLKFHQQQVGGYPDQMSHPEEFGAMGMGGNMPEALQREMAGLQRKQGMNDLQEYLGAMSNGQ